jgi:hypothetical protein
MTTVPSQTKKPKARKITPFRVVLFVAATFLFLFLLENSQNDANDYDTNVVNNLRNKGFEVKVEHLEEKTKKPIEIHIQQPEKEEDTKREEDDSKPFDRAVPHGHPWPSPIEKLGEKASLKVVPMMGSHRPEKDAVFSFARGVGFNSIVRFVGSLLASGYDGDIVLATEQKHDLSEATREFLEYHSQHSNVIVYPAELVCKKIKVKIRCKVFKMFVHTDIGGYLPDPRPHRELAQLRFEYYWAWSTLYSTKSRIFLLDSGDLIFQSNPFALLPEDMEKKIWVFEESDLKSIGDEPNNRLWLREGHERKYLHKLGRRPAVCAGTIVGGAPAIETFGRAMVNQWDVSQCTIHGCDQGHVNFLVHGNFLVNSPNIEDVVIQKFGDSFVMSLALQVLYGKGLRKAKLVQTGSDTVVNKKGEVAAIVHQFDKDDELKLVYEGKKTTPFLNEWKKIKESLVK